MLYHIPSTTIWYRDNAQNIMRRIASDYEITKLTENVTHLTNTSIATGLYQGNGDAQRTISVGFTPSLVILSTTWGDLSYYYNGYRQYAGVATSQYGSNSITIVSNGFNVYNDGSDWGGKYTNGTDSRINWYIWIAFK